MKKRMLQVIRSLMEYTVSNIDLKTLFILIFLFVINILYEKYIKLKKKFKH